MKLMSSIPQGAASLSSAFRMNRELDNDLIREKQVDFNESPSLRCLRNDSHSGFMLPSLCPYGLNLVCSSIESMN